MASFAEAAGIENPDQFLPTDTPPRLAAASPRDLLVNLVMGALRARHGIEKEKERGKDTRYYSGREAGFVASAAQVVHLMYGGDYDEAKHVLGQKVKELGETIPRADLIEPSVAGGIATSLVAIVLHEN